MQWEKCCGTEADGHIGCSNVLAYIKYLIPVKNLIALGRYQLVKFNFSRCIHTMEILFITLSVGNVGQFQAL